MPKKGGIEISRLLLKQTTFKADYSAIPYLIDSYNSNVRLAEIILTASFK